MLRVDDDLQQSTTIDVQEDMGRDDLNPVRDLLVPDLNELAYDGRLHYGYDDVGRSFYTFDPLDGYTMALLDNDLDDLNSLVTSFGSISHLYAIAAHSRDSFWAVAEFSLTGQTLTRLIQIDQLSDDVNNADSWERASITVYPNDIGSSNIVGLAEVAIDTGSQLYGIDSSTNTLLLIDDMYDATGATSGMITQSWSLNNDDLVITGLTESPAGDSLIALHDQLSAGTISQRLRVAARVNAIFFSLVTDFLD